MSLPKWLQARLGTPARGRGCRAARCLVCRADVIMGFDEDQMALPAICDPRPLSALGEALALIEGRHSYRLDDHKDGMALWRRDHWQIGGSPASEEVLVLTDHKCHGAQYPGIEIKQTTRPGHIGRVPFDATPPF